MTRDEQIIKMRKEGVSFSELAEKFNVSAQRISQICIKGGLRANRNFVETKKGDAISEKELAESLGVPVEVITWNITSFAEQDGLVEGIHYAKQARRYHLSAPAVLWLASKLGLTGIDKCEKVYEVIRLLNDGEKEGFDKLQARYNKLQKQLNDYYNAKEAADKLFNSVVNVASGKSLKPRPIKKNSENLPDLTPEESAWESDTTARLKEYVRNRNDNSTFSSWLVKIYGIMTREYGVVFDQEKKELKDKFKLDEEEHVSTMRLITYEPRLRSLFTPILEDIINGRRVA